MSYKIAWCWGLIAFHRSRSGGFFNEMGLSARVSYCPPAAWRFPEKFLHPTLIAPAITAIENGR